MSEAERIDEVIEHYQRQANEWRACVAACKNDHAYLREIYQDATERNELVVRALSALRAQEQNEPQCKDCKHLGKAWACENCTHDRELRNRTSYYEPKGADK